jgi:UDP-N-acetylmuramyl-tripeptide synthetase
MQLIDLLDEAALPLGHRDTPITGLTSDSRAVRPGMVFAALKGARSDGLDFVGRAIAAGAVAVLSDRVPEVALPEHVALVLDPDPRRRLALMAARFHAPQPEVIVAVTGTSGKTSVASFTRQLFDSAGLSAASVGTLGVMSPSGADYGGLTTPDPVALHAGLARLAREGVTHLAMEASSHGLDQRRLDGVRLAAAGFTNLGRDHLDYHASVEEYFEAKLRLFEELLSEGGTMVVDVERPEAERVAAIAKRRGLPLLTVGRGADGLRLVDLASDGLAQHLTIETGDGRRAVRLPLAGTFQVSNALIAAGLAIAGGVSPDRALAGLERLEGAKGRLEKAGETENGALVFIDYAHKPEALESILHALRPFARGRLIVLFGAGGDRDAGKRPVMGEIAARGADVVIVTDDNPRSEEPAAIRRAILDAAPGALEIGDRRTAIHRAVAMLEPGDVLVVAGKGHEMGQIVGDEVLPFSDHEVVGEALRARRAA